MTQADPAPLESTANRSPQPARQSRTRARASFAILLVILLVNVLLKAPNLGHPTLKPMDESFHAVVARNLLYDPFTPTLVREPYLRYNPTDWLSNHVWIHKPVLPLWIIAISYKLLGVDALALRLPSLIFSTAAVGLTFLIARRVYGVAPALTAAALQSIAPAIGMVVQGYVFSDAIDVNLLFWSELSLFLMLQANRRWVWLSGAAAGAAFMSKTFPALFVLGPLALVALLRADGLWPSVPDEDKSMDSEMGPTNARPRPRWSPAWKREIALTLLGWLIPFLLIALPWNIYCAMRFPVEFNAEFGLILTHLSSDVENWASPWDRLWFQHLPSALYLFWTTSLAGSVILTFRAIQLKRWPWLFAPVWMAAVLVPFTLATSKTPTATLIAWPALMIAAGFLIWRAGQGYLVELSALVTLLIAATFFSGKFISIGWGMTEPIALMRQAQWIAWHVAAGLCVAAIALTRDVRLSRSQRWVVPLVLVLLVLPAQRTLAVAWNVATMPQPPDLESQLKGRARHLPENAVIFVSKPDARRRNEIMFYLDRTSYVMPDDPKAAAETLKEVRSAGGDVWLFKPDRGPGHDPMFHLVE